MQTVRHNDQMIQRFAEAGHIALNEGEAGYTAPQSFQLSDFTANEAFQRVSVNSSTWAVSGLNSPTLDQMQELTGIVASIRSLHQQLTQQGNIIQAFTGFNIVRQ